MGARDYLRSLADGGDRGVHHECRNCGRNLDADRDSCPTCGGSVARYDL